MLEMIFGLLLVAASLAAIPDRQELDDLHKRERELNEKMRTLAEKKRQAEMAGTTGDELRSILNEEHELRRERDRLRDARHGMFEHNRRKMPRFGRDRRLEEFRKADHRRVPGGAHLLQDSETKDKMELRRDEMLNHDRESGAETIRDMDREEKKRNRIADFDWKSRKSEIIRRIEELRQQKREDEETEEDLADRPRDEVDVEIEALEAELFAGRKDWERRVEEQREADKKEMEREHRRREMGDDAQSAEERAKKLDNDKHDVDEEMRKQAEQRKLKMEEERNKLNQESGRQRNGAPPLSIGKIILIGGVVLVGGCTISVWVRNTKAKKFKHKKNDQGAVYDQMDSGCNGWP